MIMYAKSVILLAVFVASAVAVPLSSRGGCARHCRKSSKLNYEQGKTYKYEYAADTATTMSGTIDEESRLHIKATVLFKVLSDCDMSMKLEDVSLEESDPKYSSNRELSDKTNEFRKDLQRNPLRFSFQDGAVESLCAPEQELPWVLNVKRGILSTFQNTMANLNKDEKLKEVDVAGKCLVTYHVQTGGWRTTNVKKNKDLTSCTDRQTAHTSIQSASYEHDSDIKSNPMITGNQECQQAFSSQVLKKAECKETLIFKPFSHKESGAVTVATQVLTYNSEYVDSSEVEAYESVDSTLIFNHEPTEKAEERQYREAENALVQLCSHSVDDIQKEVPQLFTQYVYKLRQLSHANLQALFSRTPKICQFNVKGKKYFTDALPSVGTEQAVKMMAELYQQKAIGELEADYWFTSFAFIPKPDLKMLSHVLPILNTPRKQAVLGITSMVQTYCLTDTECASKPEVRQIVLKLVNMLNRDCSSNSDEMNEKVLVALKGLGNAGHSDEAINTLNQCANNVRAKVITRLAAIEAFRRQSCNANRGTLMTLFRDLQENTEVRIAAYLAIMKCPSKNIIESVKQVLDVEQVNQVGSFIWTHLTNMQETTDPCKSFIKELLSSEFLEQKFNTDARKFSRSYEASLFSERLNLGAHADSNLIFTPQSYLPKSAMFNFTMDLFGRSLNLFEVGGRVEGFEHIVESFFGPNGHFPEKNVKKFLENSRTRRSVYDNKIDQFKKLFQAQDANRDAPKGSVYFKMFGNELMFENLEGMDSILKYAETKINWVEILADLARNRDVEYTKSVVFMDASYTIPTGAGLPLTLNVNGTSNLHLKVGGKLDVRNLLNKEIDIIGHIKPSGAVEISAVMSVDAFYAKTGIKMVGTLHSSTLVDGKIQVKGGKVISTEIKVPRDKIEILDIQSNIFLIHKNSERRQSGIEEERTEMHGCSGDTISKITGMKLCGTLQFPNASLQYNSPYFPMTGPTKFSIYLEKTDLKMTSYKFDASYQNTQDKKTILISLDTPGSNVDREITVHVDLDRLQNSVAFRLNTPIKKIEMTGSYDYVSKNKKAELTLKMDDREKLALSAQLEVQKQDDFTKYTPTLEIRLASMKKFSVKGSTVIQPNQKFTSELTIEKLSSTILDFKVDISKQSEDRYMIDSKLNSYPLTAKVKGTIHSSKVVVTTNMMVEYRILESRSETLKIQTKYQDRSVNSLTKFKIDFNIDSSAFPDYSTRLKWDTQMAQNHMENTLKVVQGIKGRNQIDITVQEVISYSFTAGKNSIYSNIKLKVPTKNINYVWYFKHMSTKNYVKTRCFVQYASRQRVDLQFLVHSDLEKKVTGKVKLTYPGREMYLQTEAEKLTEKSYQGLVIGQWQKGKMVKTTVKYIDASSDYELKHNVEMDIEAMEKNIKYIGEIKSNADIYETKNQLKIDNDMYTLNAEYIIALKKFSSSVSVAGERYSVDALVKEEPETMTGNIDIKLHTYRDIKGMAVYSTLQQKKTAQLKVYWDAKNDISQKIDFEGSFNVASKEVSATFYYPTRTLKANVKPSLVVSGQSVESKIVADFSWEQYKKIAVEFNWASNGFIQQLTTSVKTQSPFNGYQRMSFEHTHSLGRKTLTSRSSASMESRNVFEIVFDGKYEQSAMSVIAADLKVKNTLKDFAIKVLHGSSASHFNSNGTFTWGRQGELAFGVSGNDQGNQYSTHMAGKMFFVSNFETRTSISGGFKHKCSGNQINSKATLKWNDVDAVEINFGGSQLRSGRTNICKSTIRIGTPFNGYRNILSNIVYENNGEKIKIDSDVQWPRNKASLGIVKLVSFNKYSKKTELAAYFKSPFTKDVSVSSDLTLQGSRFNGKLAVDVQSFGEYKTEVQGNVAEATNFDVQGKVSTPMDKLRNADMKLKVTINSMSLENNLEASLNQQKISSDIKVKYVEANNKVTWSLDLKTPMQNYRQVVINGNHQYQRGTVNNDVTYNNRRQSVKLNHVLRYTSLMNFQNKIDITHPYSDYPQFSVENTQSIRPNVFAHKSILRTDDSRYWKMEIDYSLIEGSKVSSAVLIEDHSGKILSVNSAFEQSRNSYNPSVRVAWRKDSTVNFVQVTGSLNGVGMQKRSAGISLASNLRNYESFSLRSDFDIENYSKKAGIKFTSPKNQVTSLTVKYNTYRKTGSAEFTSPIENYEHLILEGNYVIAENMNGMVSFQWSNDKKVKVTGTLMKRDYQVSSSVTLLTPFQSYEELILVANYDLTKSLKTSELTFQYAPNKVIAIRPQIQVAEKSANMKMTLTCPSEVCPSVTIVSKYDLSMSSKTAEISIQSPKSKDLSFTGAIDVESPIKSGRITVNTPFESVQTAVLSSRLDTSNDDAIIGNIKANWNTYNTVELNGNFRKQADRAVVAVLKITSPFENWESLNFDMNLEKMAEGYKGSSSASWGTEKMSVEILSKLQPFILTIKADSPFDPVKDVDMTISFLQNNGLELKTDLKWKSINRIVAEVMVDVSRPSEIRSHLLITTPFSSFRRFNLQATGMSTQQEMAAGFKAETPFEMLPSLEITSTLKNEEFKKVYVDFKIQTDKPITEIVADYSSQNNREEAKLRLSLPVVFSKQQTVTYSKINNQRTINFNSGYTNYALKYNLNIAGSKKQVSTELSIPTMSYKYRSLKFEGWYELVSGRSLNFNTKFQNKVDTHQMDANMVSGGNRMTGNFEVVTPFLNSGKASAKVILINNEQNKKIELNANNVQSEYSLEAEMNRIIGKELSAQITLKSPQQVFGNVKVETTLKKRAEYDIEGSISLETPSGELSSISTVIRATRSVMQTTVKVQSTIRDYEQVILDAKIDHDAVFSRIEPSFSVDTPKWKYNLNVNYLENETLRTVKLNFLKNGRSLYEINAELSKKQYMASVMLKRLSGYAYKQYSANVNYDVVNYRHTVSGSVTLPQNKRITVNTEVSMNSVDDFGIKFGWVSTFSGFESSSTSISRRATRYNSQNVFTSSWSSTEVANIKFVTKSQDASYEGQLDIKTQWNMIKESSITYNFGKVAQRQNADLKVTYSKKTLLNIESICDKSRTGSVKNLKIQLPTMSTEMNGELKTGSAYEMVIGMSIPTRKVSMKTSYAPSRSGFKQMTTFAWGTSSSSAVSYEVNYLDRSSGSTTEGELTVKATQGSTVYEIRTTHQISERDVKFTSKFLWDPIRNERKQMIVVVEGHDTSVYGKTSYNAIVDVKSPSLYKDIKISGALIMSKLHREMFKTSVRVDYSGTGDRRKTMTYELKLADETKRRNRDGISYTLSSRLLHPASVTYINFFSGITLNEQTKKVDARFSYVDTKSTRSAYVFKTTYNKNKLSMQMASPKKSYLLVATGDSSAAEMVLNVNRQKTVSAEWSFQNRKDVLATGEVTYLPTNDGLKFKAFGGDSVSMEVNHKDSGRDISDFLFTLGITSPKVLSSRMIWRTSIVSDIKNELTSKLNNYYGDLKAKITTMIEDGKTEVSAKMANLVSANLRDLSVLLKDVETMKVDMKRDYMVLKVQLDRMYANNEFYVQDIEIMINKISASTRAMLKNIASTTIETLKCMKNCMIDMAYTVGNFAVEAAKGLKNFATGAWDSFLTLSKNVFEIICNEITEKWNHFCSYVQSGLEYVVVSIESAFEATVQSVKYFVLEYLPFANFIEECYESVVEYINIKLASFYESRLYALYFNYYERFYTFAVEVYEMEILDLAAHQYEAMWNKFSDKYHSIQNSLNEYYQVVLDHPHIAFANELANHGYQKMAWAIRFWGIDQGVNNIYEEWFSILSAAMTEIAHDATSKYTTFIQDSKFNFEPLMGRIEVDIRLPSSRDNLKHLLDIENSPEYQYITSLRKNYMPGNRLIVLDYWNMYKPSSDASSWIPPFKTQALVAGNQHFMTFDKLFYDFAGECSYVLANDMIDGNFTVILNYEKSYGTIVKKSIIALVDGKKIEITPTFKFLVDDRKLELPYQYENTAIKRFDDTITIENKNGITVKCNFYRDVCTVDMSGFYFAKTGGLFGVYDNEPKLDMTKPNGKRTSSLTEFATSWAAGTGSCREENYAKRASANDYVSEEACKSLFKSKSSPLRPCFKVADTEEFMQMCRVDVQNKKTEVSTAQATCTSAYAYKQHCLAQEIEVSMPSSCSTCKKPDGSEMTAYEDLEFNKNNKPSAADIVFIVEEKECNKDKFERLEEIAQSIEKSLSEKRIRKASYSVVAFGGDGVHDKPHVHYSESEEFGTYRTVASAFRSLTVGNGNRDIYEAIRFATNLRFTPGAAKSFVLVKCSSCNNNQMKDNYGDLLRMLVDQDINLHVLMDEKLELRSGGRKSRGIFGVDKNEAFTAKDARDKVLAGDKDIKAQVIDIKDFCVPMSFETNGTLFDSNYLLSHHRSNQKNFVHVLSKRIAKTSNAPDCQICTCQENGDARGKIECFTCLSPFDIGLFSANLPDFSPYPEAWNMANDYA